MKAGGKVSGTEAAGRKGHGKRNATRINLLIIIITLIIAAILIIERPFGNSGSLQNPGKIVITDSGIRQGTGSSSPYPLAPDFTGITQWLNSNPLSMKELRGKVVIVDFWTYSCINCIRTLPYLEDWYA